MTGKKFSDDEREQRLAAHTRLEDRKSFQRLQTRTHLHLGPFSRQCDRMDNRKGSVAGA